ncbi:MAG TPA: tetratricopeptide repeat protein [Candidatus Acidoferrum sp.]|nr:tetratricopeptide repeat protein [Candidatus Acidoferrum sp.]
MKLKTLFRTSLVLLMSFAFVLTADVALAQKAKKKEEDPATEIGAQTGKILQKASELINANQMAQARAALADLKLDKLSPHERAIVEQMNVQMDVSEEKFPSARQHMQAAIDSGGLNDKEIADGRYFIAQTFVQEEKWAEGAKGIEEWLKTAAKPNGNVYYLLAVCYYQLEKLDQAIPNAKKAVDMMEKMQEGWLQLYGSLLINKERYKDALPVIERLVNAFPQKKQYWMQLSSIYGQTEDLKNALVSMQLANDLNLLTEGAEYQRMADLMMAQDMPYNAATVVSKAIDDKKINPDTKTWQFLGNAYVAAREYKKALPFLERAAQGAENGNEFVRLGQVNMQLNQWDAAVSALEKALNKGGLRDAGEVQLDIGISLFSAKKLPEAKSWLEKIPANSNQAKTAKGFLQVINANLKTR